jgi:uncharacterized protein YeaO (DUF488 family)
MDEQRTLNRSDNTNSKNSKINKYNNYNNLMATVSVSVSDELKKRMDSMQETNWSAVARKAFESQLENSEKLKEFQKIVAKSKLTERDAREISDSINKAVMRHFLSLKE